MLIFAVCREVFFIDMCLLKHCGVLQFKMIRDDSEGNQKSKQNNQI